MSKLNHVHEDSVKNLRAFLKENPKRARELWEEVGKQNYGGPSVDHFMKHYWPGIYYWSIVKRFFQKVFRLLSDEFIFQRP